MKVRSLVSPRALPILALAIAMTLAACGGDPEVAAVVPTPTPVAPTAVPPTAVPPTAVPDPTATPVPPTPEPTATLEPTPEPTVEPTATEEPEPESTDEAPADDAGSAGLDTATDGDTEVVPVADAATIYSMNCARCHGPNGEGATARSITGIGDFFAADPSPLINLVTNGGTQMPSFGEKLSTDEIVAVVDYVVSTF